MNNDDLPLEQLSRDREGVDEKATLDVEAKPGVDHVENEPVEKLREADLPLRSHYADWTRRQCIRKFWRMYILGIMVSTAGLYSGYVDAAPGGVVANKGFIDQMATTHDPDGKLALDANIVSIWGVCQQCITLVPQLLAPIISDAYGRRIGLGVFILAGCIAVILEIVAKNWKVWLAARMMEGVMVGQLQAGPLTLMSELVMPQMRGNVLSTFALCWCGGGLFAAIGMQIVNTTTPLEYRRFIYSEWVLIGIFAICCLFVPESPVWLIKKGRIDAAKKSYARVIGKMDDFDFEHEFAVIQQDVRQSQIMAEKIGKSDWKIILKWVNFRRVLIPVLAYGGQAWVGGGYIYSFTVYFFQQAGLSNPFLANTIVSLISFVGIAFSMLIYDRVGRRSLMIWGTLWCCATNFLIGGLAFLPIDQKVGAGLITATCLWVSVYAVTYYPVGWTAQVEMSSPLLRAKSAGLCAFIHGFGKILWNYTVPQMLSPQKAGWGAKIGIFFGGITAVWFIPVFFYYPETRGRSYAAIDELFERRVSERKFEQTMTQFDTPEFEAHIGRKKTWKEWLRG